MDLDFSGDLDGERIAKTLIQSQNSGDIKSASLTELADRLMRLCGMQVATELREKDGVVYPAGYVLKPVVNTYIKAIYAELEKREHLYGSRE